MSKLYFVTGKFDHIQQLLSDRNLLDLFIDEPTQEAGGGEVVLFVGQRHQFVNQPSDLLFVFDGGLHNFLCRSIVGFGSYQRRLSLTSAPCSTK